MAEPENDPAGPGWLRTKSAWSQLAIGVVIALIALLVLGWDAWPLGATVVLMGSVQLLPGPVYWSLAGALLAGAVVFWAITD